jgi:hypothetical protein
LHGLAHLQSVGSLSGDFLVFGGQVLGVDAGLLGDFDLDRLVELLDLNALLLLGKQLAVVDRNLVFQALFPFRVDLVELDLPLICDRLQVAGGMGAN